MIIMPLLWKIIRLKPTLIRIKMVTQNPFLIAGLNGFVNKSFSDGGANSVDIPSIHVNDITEKHVNDVTDTQNDDVKVNMDDNKTHEEFEMGTHVTELNGKDYSHHNSLNDNNFTGQLNGSGVLHLPQ